jgi:hypothetical protein
MPNAWDHPHKIIENVLGNRKRDVFYSAYGTGRNDNDVAIEGKAIISMSVDPFWCPDNAKPYRVEVENPTWIDLAIHADYAIKSVKDYHHVFFEGIHNIGTSAEGLPMYEFAMGS